MIRSTLLAFTCFAVAALFANCRKEVIVTNTVYETDTLYVTEYDTTVVHLTDTLTLTQFLDDTATTFIVLRHAETTGVGTDPGLSTDGQTRADELARVLKNVPLTAAYSSNYNRTKQTAQPSATDHGLMVQTYDALSVEALADAALAAHKGEAVLILGHSNTVPNLLNVLVGTNAFPQIADTEYDNLFVVTVFKKGKATVVHMKYGKPS